MARSELTGKCPKCSRPKGTDYEYCAECHDKQKREAAVKTFETKTARLTDANLKGRLAEALVEEIFKACDYEVHRIGAEHIAESILSRKNPRLGEAALLLRRLPDFFVIKDDETRLIEVKYRSSGKYPDCEEDKQDIEKHPYDEAFIVLVSPGRIDSNQIKALKKGLHFRTLYHSGDFPGLDQKIVLKYLSIAQSFINKKNR